jgi:hypothetical protein
VQYDPNIPAFFLGMDGHPILSRNNLVGALAPDGFARWAAKTCR